MGLKLSITPNKTDATALVMTFLGSSTNTAIYGEKYTLTLVDLNFNKQMYLPCEINARIQITVGGASISLSDLQSIFLNAKVSLSEETNSDNTIASNYYVQELIFEKSTTTEILVSGAKTHTTTEYVQFKIFSLDKLLTLKRDNYTYVSKRLAHDILKDKAGKTELPYDSNYSLLSSDSQKTSLVNIALKNKLAYSTNKEYIQPYLVQHDESFYDMLIRTANRWGEFVYFEGGKLVIGCDSSNSNKTFTDGYSISTKLDKKSDIRDIVTNDDYLEVITKGDYLKHSGDLFAFDKGYAHKLTQSFVNMSGSLWEWLTDRAIDDEITAGHNHEYIKKKTKEYNAKFFDTPLSNTGDDLVKLHYNSDTDNKKNQTQCRQFATYENDGGLTSKAYQIVLSNELTAGEDELCIDLGENYQHLVLGHIITIGEDEKKYLVTRVECTVDKETVLKTDPLKKFGVCLEEEKHLHYHVYAVKAVGTNVYYPPMLPTGHVRFSNPLKGVVVDTMDPKMQCRYRVTNGDNSNAASPWICVSHEMLSKGGGSVWQLEKNTEVLLDFKYGNVELPFIAGVLQKKDNAEVTRHSMFNNMSYQTPAGHAVRLNDGYGAGAANFIANFIPFVGFIKGFVPEGSAWHTESGIFEDYVAYEGGMELTDKYGIYSIKASTDERNISIKSPYGDVTLNAFTGITISAPNGNVKIQGKNVSIEAGNNLTLISGKNIEKGFLGSVTLGNGMGAEEGIDKCLAGLSAELKYLYGKAVSNFDIPLLRHTWEVIVRPVAGVMELRSHRAMKIHAGINVEETTENQIEWKDKWAKMAAENNNIAQMIIGTRDYRIKGGISDTNVWGEKLAKNGEIVFERKSNDAIAILKTGNLKPDITLPNPNYVDAHGALIDALGNPVDAPQRDPASKNKVAGDVVEKLDATHLGFVF